MSPAKYNLAGESIKSSDSRNKDLINSLSLDSCNVQNNEVDVIGMMDIEVVLV